MSDAATQERKQVKRFRPFTLTFDNGNNGTLLLPPPAAGHRVRMEWRQANHFNRKNRLGRPAAKSLGALSAMPDLPGMQLHIKPHDKRPGWIICEITDPLKDRPELLEQASAVLSEAAIIGSDAKRKAAPDVNFEFDPDSAKTFLIGLRKIVDEGWASGVNGQCPTEEELSELPGEEIYDPLSPIGGKKRYVREVVGV